MKEFEDWWSRGIVLDPDTKNFFELGWKAALEWVRDNLVIDSSANEIIEQELQE